jgi:hypothetical protein
MLFLAGEQRLENVVFIFETHMIPQENATEALQNLILKKAAQP